MARSARKKTIQARLGRKRGRCGGGDPREADGALALVCRSSRASVTAAGSEPPPCSREGSARSNELSPDSVGARLLTGPNRPLDYVVRVNEQRPELPATRHHCQRPSCPGANGPPLRVNGQPTVGSGADASMVGTTTQSDGNPQVTYNGHLLYLYSGDQNPATRTAKA